MQDVKTNSGIYLGSVHGERANIAGLVLLGIAPAVTADWGRITLEGRSGAPLAAGGDRAALHPRAAESATRVFFIC